MRFVRAATQRPNVRLARLSTAVLSSAARRTWQPKSLVMRTCVRGCGRLPIRGIPTRDRSAQPHPSAHRSPRPASDLTRRRRRARRTGRRAARPVVRQVGRPLGRPIRARGGQRQTRRVTPRASRPSRPASRKPTGVSLALVGSSRPVTGLTSSDRFGVCSRRPKRAGGAKASRRRREFRSAAWPRWGSTDRGRPNEAGAERAASAARS